MATTIIINNKNYVADINRSIDCIPLNCDGIRESVGKDGRYCSSSILFLLLAVG